MKHAVSRDAANPPGRKNKKELTHGHHGGPDSSTKSLSQHLVRRAIWLITLAFMNGSALNAFAQTAEARENNTNTATADQTRTGNTVENRGWEGLAKMLDALTPSINTEETPSGTQITDEIERLINQGRAAQALTLIESREAELAAATAPGTDVQLMFQKARALTALDRLVEAQSIYQQMTVRFPELAEPWNNLAMLYVRSGSLDEAEFALETAVMNNPANGNAIANLADVRLLMALRDYREAARMKVPGAARRLKALESFLKEN